MQEEKKARAHLFTLLLVRTGCPALLLTDHVTGAPGPASQGQLPLGPRLEQQIKLWRKEGHETERSDGGFGGSSRVNM